MDTFLIINSTKDGKKLQKAITNINPEKDNAILKTFAQKVNGLTSNTYIDATRINKQSVNEEGGGGSSPTPATTKDEPVMLIDFDGETGYYEYNGDGQIFGYVNDTIAAIAIDRDNQNWYLVGEGISPSGQYTITLHATEGENYAAKSVSYTYGG